MANCLDTSGSGGKYSSNSSSGTYALENFDGICYYDTSDFMSVCRCL